MTKETQSTCGGPFAVKMAGEMVIERAFSLNPSHAGKKLVLEVKAIGENNSGSVAIEFVVNGLTFTQSVNVLGAPGWEILRAELKIPKFLKIASGRILLTSMRDAANPTIFDMIRLYTISPQSEVKVL